MSDERIYAAHDFHEAGILYELGFEVKNIALDPGPDRVVFTFSDPEHKALDTIRQHRQGILQMRTIKLVEAFRWARRQTFTVRDSEPHNAPRPGGSRRFPHGSRGFEDSERRRRNKEGR